MPEPLYAKRPPKWATMSELKEPPDALGVSPVGPPRLSTRILPFDHGDRLPSTVVRDLLDLTQKLLYFSGYVAAFGYNPDFADLRSLDRSVLRVSTMAVSPFEGGSFVIAGTLPDDDAELEPPQPAQAQVGPRPTLHASRVVETFTAAMGLLSPNTSLDLSARLPIGFVQAVDELDAIFSKHAERIEYTPTTDSFRDQNPKVVAVDKSTVAQAQAAMRYRKGRQDTTNVTRIVATIVGLDILRNTVRLQWQAGDQKHTATGTFDPALIGPLVRFMGREVRIDGTGEYRKRILRRIAVSGVHPLEGGAGGAADTTRQPPNR